MKCLYALQSGSSLCATSLKEAGSLVLACPFYLRTCDSLFWWSASSGLRIQTSWSQGVCSPARDAIGMQGLDGGTSYHACTTYDSPLFWWSTTTAHWPRWSVPYQRVVRSVRHTAHVCDSEAGLWMGQWQGNANSCISHTVGPLGGL